MTHPRDYLPILDHIEAALEASCGALITLQSIDVDSTPNRDGMHGHIAEAIYSLRHAIDELRSAQSRGASGLALGFVLARGRRCPAQDPDDGQSRPRRTA
jgi:hypothetical protein